MSSLLRVMKMAVTLTFQCQNRYNLQILLSPLLFKFLLFIFYYLFLFLPCIEDNASLESSTWNTSHEAEQSKHFKECMIQRLCENSMVRFGQKDFLNRKDQKPARKRFSRRLKDHSQQYCEAVLKQLRSQRPRNHQAECRPRFFQPRPKDKIAGRDKSHQNIL
ncbi:hypothetical protein GQ457_06G015530 [Hibiscus cannabinus]